MSGRRRERSLVINSWEWQLRIGLEFAVSSLRVRLCSIISERVVAAHEAPGVDELRLFVISVDGRPRLLMGSCSSGRAQHEDSQPGVYSGSVAGRVGNTGMPTAVPQVPQLTGATPRTQPWLGHQVEKAGGVKAWNSADPERAYMLRTLDAMCQAKTAEQALIEVQAIMSLGHNLWAYAYMRMLHSKRPEVYYGALLLRPSKLLPVVYTPTVGEACQKFGKMPQYERGCYVSLQDKGHLKATLAGYAARHMRPAAGGKFVVDCIVFSGTSTL